MIQLSGYRVRKVLSSSWNINKAPVEGEMVNWWQRLLSWKRGASRHTPLQAPPLSLYLPASPPHDIAGLDQLTLCNGTHPLIWSYLKTLQYTLRCPSSIISCVSHCKWDEPLQCPAVKSVQLLHESLLVFLVSSSGPCSPSPVLPKWRTNWVTKLPE